MKMNESSRLRVCEGFFLMLKEVWCLLACTESLLCEKRNQTGLPADR